MSNNPDEVEQQEDEEQSRREAYEYWLAQKKLTEDIDLLMYEPRDREQFINKHELNTEKDL